MKLYLVGNPVTVADIKVKGFLFFGQTHVTKGRVPYSNEHIIALLLDDLDMDAPNKEHINFAFADLDAAYQYISELGLSGRESHSATYYRNDANYRGSEFAPFIYEIEVDSQNEDLKTQFYYNTSLEFVTNKLTKEKFTEEANKVIYGNNIQIPCYKLSDATILSSTVISATLVDSKHPLGKKPTEYNIPRFEDFKQSYMDAYKKETFKNPRSKMKTKLESEEISRMTEVYEHTDKYTESRAATVLASLTRK